MGTQSDMTTTVSVRLLPAKNGVSLFKSCPISSSTDKMNHIKYADIQAILSVNTFAMSMHSMASYDEFHVLHCNDTIIASHVAGII